MPAVELIGVSKRFGNHQAVQPLDLTIPRGAVQGFIGPNGSGKTTTLRMILGIIPPDTGAVHVLGQNHARAANDLVGYLPEERGLYRKMTVRRVTNYFGALKGLSRSDAQKASREWLERFDLADWENAKVETLSKGMQQKVQFICTIIARPQLVILDEPFSGLDPVNMEVLRTAVLSLKEQGTTIIFSTHDMTKAEEMCDRICMIYRGEKVIDGSLQEIQAAEGGELLRVRTAEGRRSLDGVAGISALRDLGQNQEFKLDGNPQDLLRHLMQRTQVEHFEITRASLHDIFLRIAGPSLAEEEQVA